MSDQDVVDLYAAVMATPPISHAVQPNRVTFPFNIRLLISGWKNLFFSPHRYRIDPAHSAMWNRGAYLANGLTHCVACHSPLNALGAVIDGKQYDGNPGGGPGGKAPPLTATALLRGGYCKDSLAETLKTGVTPSAGKVGNEMGLVISNETSHWTDDDRKSRRRLSFRSQVGRTAVADTRLCHLRTRGETVIPLWLHFLFIIALVAGFVSFSIVIADVIRHPQNMTIRNIVWPVTCLFGTGFTLWLYYRYGRQTGRPDNHSDHRPDLPFPVIVAKGALHCGAGCMLGDLIAEWLAFLTPAIAIALGWHWLFGEKILAVWVLDFIFAFLLGIIFQYYAIAPMRNLSLWAGIAAALKADTLSLISWQIGMYGFMALAQFYLLGMLLGTQAQVNTPEFWFLMQLAMLVGFATAYPVNWWLIRIGIKEAM